MFDIVAPLSAPQIPAPKPPPPPAPPKVDWLEQRIVDLIHESEPVKLWSALNVVAEELSPRNRAEGREARMKLLPRMQRLIDLGMIFRGWKNSVATYKPAPKPAGMPRRRRKRTVMKAIFTKAVSKVQLPRPPEAACRGFSAESQIDLRKPPPSSPAQQAEETKTATAEIVTNAASALATLPRRPRRRWSGWIGKTRSFRNMRVQLPGGQRAFVFGVLRGRLVYTVEPDGPAGDPFSVGVNWGVVPASAVRILKNEHAVALGKRKGGTKEKFSPRKREAARVNGRLPAKAGRLRGRPRTAVTLTATSTPGTTRMRG